MVKIKRKNKKEGEKGEEGEKAAIKAGVVTKKGGVDIDGKKGGEKLGKDKD